MTNIWNSVRLPGVWKPSTRPPYKFELPAGQSVISRAAFDGSPRLSKSSYLRFSIHSPTSKAMFPDIIRGDFGFPTVCLKNEQGTVYRFARGNLKDFFDITRPNEEQTVSIPVTAFVYDIDLKVNVPTAGNFFDVPLAGVYFDFLSHPEEPIDLVIGGVDFSDGADASAAFSVQDFVTFERVGQAPQLPPFSTETSVLALAASLSNVGVASNLQGSELVVQVNRGGLPIGEYKVKLDAETRYLNIRLDERGSYWLHASVRSGGKVLASTSWPACRVIPRMHGKSTILGISDAGDYDRIGALGGTWDRLPIDGLPIVRSESGSIRFAFGSNTMPRTPAGVGRFRVMAPFRMPRWLSSASSRPDFYRYRPAEWSQYSEMVEWLAHEMSLSGATHYEVWNEASTIGHWNDSIPNLIELHRVTYQAVKRVNADMVVLGGCTHSWTFDFLRKFLETGGSQYCDGLAIHGYTYQPHECIQQFDGVEKLIAEFVPDRAEFKAYITEIGFRYPAFSLESQAKYLALYTIEAASRPTIGAILWFRYTNPRPEVLSRYQQNSSTGYALVGHNGSYARPALAAFRFVERLLQQFDEVRASGPAAARRYEFVKDGSVEAIGLYQPEGAPVLPGGWTVLDQYGAPVDGHADLRVAVSPRSAHLLRH